MSPHQNGFQPLQSTTLSSQTESKPVNSGIWHRYSTLLAVKILKCVRPRHENVLMLTDKLCVIYGRHVQLSEASAMCFISRHTSIPVPKVFCAFTYSGLTYIVMERIKGDMIGSGWAHQNDESKAKVLSQLARMVTEMRELQPPDGIVAASVDGGPLFDCRVPRRSLHFGPFNTMHDFHRHLRMGMEFDPGLDSHIQDLINQQSKTWPSVFTHGDLSSLNMLIHNDTIVAIIDWETAGWYPSYWEYTSAHQANPQNSFWVHEIDKFLQPMPEELGMERIHQEHFGDT
ncbi:kinase-like domain-containing protein [Aspergillus pseudonomiae]|uniref:Kinase-like domain-containing protein n=1 Tax=Aspergillus pseudonomiae TaxID=1506151 RepID=A0A5N7DFR0_9EURO|nr:kinase-like domain-containing protein [Aspergillus pseudonomiae]KAE8405035.1 kinase-like domain-containing protein [Aspergillus pseudonomiae]